jgi:hypothetical protein
MVPILRRERDRASTVSFACVGSQFDAVSAVSHSDESHSSQQPASPGPQFGGRRTVQTEDVCEQDVSGRRQRIDGRESIEQ